MAPNKLLDKYIKEIAAGNKDSIALLYKETKDAIYGYALSILKNKSLAEDVLQDTYVIIYEKAYLYKSNGKPLGWIFTIVKNTCLMKIRSNKNHLNIDDLKDVLSGSKQDIDNKLFLSYLFKHVSDEERTIVILHALSGFKHHEIAKLMKLPLGTVLSKYKRTINKLKKIAKEDNYD